MENEHRNNYKTKTHIIAKKKSQMSIIKSMGIRLGKRNRQNGCKCEDESEKRYGDMEV